MKRLLCQGMPAILLAMTLMGTAAAQDIRIIGDGGDAAITVSLAHLKAGAGAAEQRFLKTLQSDLDQSGWLHTTRDGKGAILEAHGQCRIEDDGMLSVQAEVINTASGRSLFARIYREQAERADAMAHAVADAMVQAATGKPGIASTRIVMVGSRAGSKDLYLVGAGGDNLIPLTRDGAPCLAPSWTPDGKQIHYTSFARGFPDIYRIDLDSGRRSAVAGYPGINAGATVSPDGRRIALILSKDGNPELYTRDLDGGRLTRITHTPRAAEASPTWSPDGKRMAYVSDTTGSPQIYIISQSGGAPSRLSYRGRENVSPCWGPDGRLAFSSRRDGRYHLVIRDPDTGDETQLTSGHADHENPSWAPDGRHLAFARTEGYASSVYRLDTQTGVQIRLTPIVGDWYFPAWSPR